MDHYKKLLPGFGAMALALCLPCLSWASTLDLDRTTPVPSSQPIPAMDFFRLDYLRNPTVNLAGTKVAAIVAVGEDNSSLMVYDLKTQKTEMRGGRGDSDVTSVTWLTDDLLIFFISFEKSSNYSFCAAHPGSLAEGYPILQNITGSLIVVPPHDRTHPLARIGPHTDNSGQYGEVVTLDTKAQLGNLLDLNGDIMQPIDYDQAREGNMRHIVGTHPILETPDGFDIGYWADKEGKLAFAASSTKGVLTLHRLDGEKWVNCPEDLEEMDIVDSGENPGEILVVAPRQNGKPRPLEVLNAADGTPKGMLLQDPSYDFDGWLYRDPVSRGILGAYYSGVVPKVVWFDEGFKGLQKMFDKLPVFQGQVFVQIVGNSADGSGFLIQAYSDTHPTGYYWADLKAKTFGPIKNTRPWIDPARMQPMSLIKYKTRDGHKLDAYLTMPAGATKQNPPPVVVLPPYGQWDRNTWGFNPEAQFFASRGYAVLQPNHRGSAGYRGMFPTEDEWDFRKMYEDVIDATKTLVATGLVDRDRVAIIGAGFGGYLAMSGAAYEPSLYRCAIAISPSVLDWAAYIKENKYYEFSDPFYSRYVRKLGDPGANPGKFDALAPLRHASQIRAAVLIVNGEYDSSFVISESKDLVSILKQNNVPADTKTFVNEAGGVRHLAHKVELYSRIETFLGEHLGAGARASVSAGAQ